MNVTRVLPLVDCTRPAKTLRGITSANAPGVSRVKTPARKTVKISMSVRRRFVTRMRNVVTPLGVFLALAREDLKAMATRAAWKLMSAKLLLIRYGAVFSWIVARLGQFSFFTPTSRWWPFTFCSFLKELCHDILSHFSEVQNHLQMEGNHKIIAH